MKQPKQMWLWGIIAANLAVAFAHTGEGYLSGFGYGFMHPFGGFDHLLAMVAVGLWATQVGGRAAWVVPLAFVSAMALGGILGMSGVSLPFTESGILTSVVLLGALILLAIRPPLWIGAGLGGLFAVFHGQAHGTEMPVSVSGLEYALGFMVATALLHLAGVGLGLLTTRIIRLTALSRLEPLRWIGALILFGGIYLGFTG